MAPALLEQVVLATPLYCRAAVVPGTLDKTGRMVEVTFSTGERVLRRPAWDEPFWEELGTNEGEVILDRLNQGANVLDAHGEVTHSAGGSGLDDIIGVVERAYVAAVNDVRAVLRISDRNKKSREAWDGIVEGTIRWVSPGYRVHNFVEVERLEGQPPVRRAVRWEPFEISFLPVSADGGAHVRAAPDANRCIIQVPTQFAGVRTMPPEHILPSASGAGTTPAAIAPAAGGVAPVPVAPVAAAVAPVAAVPIAPVAVAPVAVAPVAVAPVAVAPVAVAPVAVAPVAPAAPVLAVDPASRTAVPVVVAAPVAVYNPAAPGLLDPTALERDRGIQIRAACTTAGLEPAIADDLVLRGVPLDASRAFVLDTMAARQAAQTPTGISPQVVVGAEAGDHLLRGIEDAMQWRAGYVPDDKLSDEGKVYQGVDMLRMAESLLRLRGIETGTMSNLEIATRALHSTSDFPEIVKNVADKNLRQSYQSTPKTFHPISRRRDLRDFKETTELQLGNAPILEELGQGGEIKFGTVGESGEKWMIRTYAKRLAFTRELLINDDTDAFQRIPMLFGAQAAEIENSIFWALVTGDVVLDQDGLSLFNAAHNNTGAGALDKDGVQTGREIMRQQVGIPTTGADAQLIAVQPAYLIVPGTLELNARQITASITAHQTGEVNPWSGSFRDVIIEPRLDAESGAEWYMTAGPDQIDVGRWGYLQGMSGPMIETNESFSKWAMEMRAIHWFGAAILDFRGWYRSTGVA